MAFINYVMVINTMTLLTLSVYILGRMSMLKDVQWSQQQQITKEFSVTTSLKNNGNFGASFNTDDFVYKIQLPEGVEYVNNSLTKDFQSGNSGVDINDFNVTYDAANRIITIKSTGGGSGIHRHDLCLIKY